MKILFLSTWFPYPLDTGSRIRIYYLLKALTRHQTVDLITFKTGPDCERFIPTLEKWCSRVEVLDRDPFWVDSHKNLQGLLSMKPRDVISGYSPEMMELVCKVSSEEKYDLVIASTETIAPYALVIDNIPRILEEHNFISSWIKYRIGMEKSLLQRVRYWLSWRKSIRYERWLYSQFSRCTMVSEKNQHEVELEFPFMRGKVTLIPNGVDTELNLPGLAKPIPNTLIYNGALTYRANLDAMAYFTREILPRIHTVEPSVSLKITGRHQGVDLSWLPNDSRIQLTGYLEDLRPEVARSWVCVVPLRTGSGTRLKILEAMALGTPVVSTSIGAEGIEAEPERDILIADKSEEFALQTLRLLYDPDLRERLVINGRRLVEKKYSWNEIGENFCDIVEETYLDGRLNEFVNNHN